MQLDNYFDNDNGSPPPDYAILQPMRPDNRYIPTRKRPRIPSRTEINNHLRIIANKVIDNRTTLLVQTLIQHEYKEKMNQLKKVEEFGHSDSDTSTTSSEEETEYDCYGYAYKRIVAPRRKKLKSMKKQ